MIFVAQDGAQRRTLQLLSDWKYWSGQQDSNLRPPAPKAGARAGKCLAFKTNTQAAALSEAGPPMRGTISETPS